jgi:PucR family transcriptional regulator, purine catabolism regulatory protein
LGSETGSWSAWERGLTVRAALTFGGLRSGIVLAGGHGLGRLIRWVKVLEAPETLRFVADGDLLLTLGYAIKDDPAAPTEAVRQLAAHGAAGLVIKPEPYLGEVPSAMRHLADELAVPIIWLPEKVSYADVAIPIVERLLNKETTLLRLSLDIHHRFTDLALNDQGVEAIVRALAEILQSSVLLVDADLRVLASQTIPGKVDPLREETLARGRIPPSVLGKLGITLPLGDGAAGRTVRKVDAQSDLGISRLVAPITAGGVCLGALSVMLDSPLPEELAMVAVEHAATVLALELVKQSEVAQAEQRVRGELVDDLLSGAYGEESDVLRRARYLHYDLSLAHRLLVVDIDQFVRLIRERQYDERQIIRLKQRLLGLVTSVVARRHPRPLVTSRSDSIILLVPVDGTGPATRVGHELAERIQDAVRESDLGLRVSVAIGGPCAAPRDYRAAFRQARQSLEITTRFGKGEQIVNSERLGIDRLLAQVENRHELEEFANQLLGPLVHYDEARRTALLETLDEYLRRHGNLLQAAHALHIHENTLRYRLARISEMLDLDLRDEDTRLDLLLGLRIFALSRPD